MEITYVVIITLVAYILGSITKVFIDKIPNKYIPLQNVIIGIVSALICYFTKIETKLNSDENILIVKDWKTANQHTREFLDEWRNY